MTRDVFEGNDLQTSFTNEEWLDLWVPYREDLIKIFRPEHRKRLAQVSDNEFMFSGMKFRFLISRKGLIYARTREKMWELEHFINYYKNLDIELSESSNNHESISYSQMVIQDASYQE
jgi:hypothetical protein